MKRRYILTLTAVLLLFFITSCASPEASGTLSSSDEPVGFFTEEVEIEKTAEIGGVYDEADIHFDDTYILKEGGNTYELKLIDVKTEPAFVGGRTANVSYTVTYVDTQADAVPKTLRGTYYDGGGVPPKETSELTENDGRISNGLPEGAFLPSGENASGEKPNQDAAECPVFSAVDVELTLTDTFAADSVWVGFTAPMCFKDYGAAYYKLSEGTYMPHSDGAPAVSGFEDAILSYLGLSPYSYRIHGAEWDGEAYTDPNGILCRDAILYGERLAPAVKAVYKGTAKLPDAQGYKATATYYYRGVVRNTKKVRRVLLAGIAVAAILITSIIFLLARGRKKRGESK